MLACGVPAAPTDIYLRISENMDCTVLWIDTRNHVNSDTASTYWHLIDLYSENPIKILFPQIY